MARKTKHGQAKRGVEITLTPDAIEILEQMAQRLNLRSKSEVIEQFARGMLSIDPVAQDQQSIKELHGA